MMHHDAHMAQRRLETESKETEVTRLTVSFPDDQYEQILQKAKIGRVSASWIVRDAVEKYLSADIPLFAKNDSKPV